MYNCPYTRTTELLIQGPNDPIISPKAEYITAHPGDVEQKGRARLENWFVEDRLTGKQFCDLLFMFKNSDHLLFSHNLSFEEDQYKRRLLGLLISINWNLQIPSQQIRFFKQMEERLGHLKGHKV